ncbi:hypothetical protein PMZ80_009992 [Knufia obscura]|uniref:Aspergillus nuclease S(1) n=2 Tax=Knufia TaxID=430999 RepID=A0AAN8FD21_9EURO|nr:hypothetical protein PMZ80_009992 [Knufia obscura]KAK5956081.1 hypothetical protein OHC33_002654 [Knufia fluminis]
MQPTKHHLLILLTLVTTHLHLVASWGSLGHRTTVALSLLHIPQTHPAHTLLSSLLHNQDPTTAGLFPDKIRYIPSFAYTAPWHYIDALDNPPHQCSINFTRDCLPSEGCVVTAIANHTERVADQTLPFWQRGQSMRFMLHFFGDVHQPLHTENLSRGGNDIDVMFDRQRHNLHSVWDTLIPKKIVEIAGDGGVLGAAQRWDLGNETEAAYAWAEFLYSKYGHDDRVAEMVDHVCVHDAVECALRWASEANAYVCSYVMKGGLEDLESKDLGEEYFEGAVPIIEEMIVKGGRRLARWLMMVAQDLHDAGISGVDEQLLCRNSEGSPGCGAS